MLTFDASKRKENLAKPERGENVHVISLREAPTHEARTYFKLVSF
jgi:uncharacterized DUF497 family protein